MKLTLRVTAGGDVTVRNYANMFTSRGPEKGLDCLQLTGYRFTAVTFEVKDFEAISNVIQNGSDIERKHLLEFLDMLAGRTV